MDQLTNYDLRGIAFENFVSFIFRTEIQGKHTKFWYWEAETAFEPGEIAAHYLKLFTAPEFLLAKFSKQVLDEGFWAIHASNLDCGLARLIWLEELPFAIRENCVRSTYYLFERLFAVDPLDSAANMWWDSLCYDWQCGNRLRSRGGEDQAMQDVMFETLARILRLESIQCQTAALHGLGHLHHPDTEPLIQQYLERNPTLASETKEYALAAAQFNVL